MIKHESINDIEGEVASNVYIKWCPRVNNIVASEPRHPGSRHFSSPGPTGEPFVDTHEYYTSSSLGVA